MDDGAPFSDIGEEELRFYSKRLPEGTFDLFEKPDELSQSSFCQFDVGSHAISRRPILCSVAFHFITDEGKRITIRNIVIK